jgi:alpha-mannosidase
MKDHHHLHRLSMLGLIAMILAGSIAYGQNPNSTAAIWQIGQTDSGTAELALGPADFARYPDAFPNDVSFVVGVSDPKRDFCFVHPGPGDSWAGSRSHTVTILFGLDIPETAGSVPAELFIDLADTHSQNPPKLIIQINERTIEHQTPKGSGDASVNGNPAAGRSHRIRLPLEPGVLHGGNNWLSITTATGSWILYDSVSLVGSTAIRSTPPTPSTEILGVTAQPCLLRDGGKLVQPIDIQLRRIGPKAQGRVIVNGVAGKPQTLANGTVSLRGLAPEVTKDTPATVDILIDGQLVTKLRLALQPVRKWEFYLIHQTHLDIGYTHVQTEVERMQWSFLDQAIELGKKTRNYPADSRFIWHPEGLWAVDSYLKNAAPEKRKAFFDAVRSGWIHLDAFYGNELTALCTGEELFELVGLARRLSREQNLTIDTAMITDVPGYTWGLIPAMAQSGVKYLSVGPNSGHRIGYTLADWGDKPFYWLTPDSKDKVLCWVAGMGYSWFHTGLNYKEIQNKLKPERFFDYAQRLEAAQYPYDMVQVRYNIGSDNGPPDPGIADFVKSWNEKYAYPRLVLSSSSRMFKDFESRYADRIPKVKGDFTPYWEDGAASSAQETVVNRSSADRMIEAQALYAMFSPEKYKPQSVFDAWRQILLYDEHTWGAYNSISEPKADFVAQQWKIKQDFALNGEKQSRQLMQQAISDNDKGFSQIDAALVINPCSWPRTDLAIIMVPEGDYAVEDSAGKTISSQKLATGALAFIAENVPPYSAVKYAIKKRTQPAADFKPIAEGNRLSDETITVVIDPTTGSITSLRDSRYAGDFADSSAGLNEYWYVKGKNPKEPQRNGPVTIRVLENGPVVGALMIESDAPGCNKLSRAVRVVRGLGRVDILNRLDKQAVYEKEGVHFAFPVNLPGGTMRLDIPWAIVDPQKDLMTSACRNYLTIQRWADVSGDKAGLTLASPDAPLVEIGSITTDAPTVGWLRELPATTKLYSYVMNNYWETNYKAAQDGPTVFRYSLAPHGAFDAAAAARFGVERSRPLIVVPCDPAARTMPSMLTVSNPAVLVTVLKPADNGKGYFLRLWNPTNTPQQTTIQWPGMKKAPTVSFSNPFEDKLKACPKSFTLAPMEIVALRAE